MEKIEALFQELAHKTRKTDLVIFAGRVGGWFMDNVKYFFLYCVRHKQPFTPFFLTHHEEEHRVLQQAGLPSLLFPSDEAVHILPKAKLVIADDFWWKTETPAFHLLSRAKTLQMWHGIPLKLIGFPEMASSVNMTSEKRLHLQQGYSGYDAVLSTSSFVTETSLGKAFQCTAMWETGYPRNDVLLRPGGEENSHEFLGVDKEALARLRALRKSGYKAVFFMPTFRDTGGDAFADGALDVGRLEAFGRANKVAFFLKFHPYLSISGTSDFKTVHLVRSNSDAYPLLAEADCLLTDYSSVAYDFLLTGRPQVFFPYDLPKYLARDRGMFYAYEDMAPGPRPTDAEGLFAALRGLLVDGQDSWESERIALRDQLFTHPDGCAAERLAALVRERFFSAG